MSFQNIVSDYKWQGWICTSNIGNCSSIYIYLKHVVYFYFHVPVLLPTFSSSSSSSSSSRLVWQRILFSRTVCLDLNWSMVHQFVLNDAFHGEVMYTWRIQGWEVPMYNNKEEVIRKEAHPNKDWNVQWWGLW